jgi:hypothetical protein
MSSLLFEIVELPSGEIALKPADAEGESLVSIRFSDSSEIYIPEARMTIGKVMIKAGLEALAEMVEEREEKQQQTQQQTHHSSDESQQIIEHTLH